MPQQVPLSGLQRPFTNVMHTCASPVASASTLLTTRRKGRPLFVLRPQVI